MLSVFFYYNSDIISNHTIAYVRNVAILTNYDTRDDGTECYRAEQAHLNLAKREILCCCRALTPSLTPVNNHHGKRTHIVIRT